MNYNNKSNLTAVEKQEIEAEAEKVEGYEFNQLLDYVDALESGHRYLLVSRIMERRENAGSNFNRSNNSKL